MSKSRTHAFRQFTPIRPRRKPLLPVFILGALCGWVLYAAFTANKSTVPELPDIAVRPHLVRWLEEQPESWPAQEPLFNRLAVRRIYRQEGYRLLWFNNYMLSDTAQDLIKQLNSTSSGNPSSLVDYRYHLGYFDRTLRDSPQRLHMAALLDILLTDAFISYAQDTHLEQLEPRTLKRQAPPSELTPVKGMRGEFRRVSFEAPLRTARPAPIMSSKRGKREQAELEALQREENQPFQRPLAELEMELSRYRNIARSGLWKPLPLGPAMTVGAQHKHVGMLRDILSLYGDYVVDFPPEDPNLFDPALEKAVKRFQRRHGLREDGVVGKKCRELLNIGPMQRAFTIAANLDRRHKLGKEPGSDYILVNVPEYRLRLVRDERVELSMRVIVGEAIHQTPELSTELTTVVFNPNWYVPRSIAVSELIPKARKDPRGMQALGYRLISVEGQPMPFNNSNLSQAGNGKVHLRQDGGPQNVLGRLKFVIPNRENIYLHDTQTRSLFRKRTRTYSHGCIRLDRPNDLAAMVLAGDQGQHEWDTTRVEELTQASRTKRVRLEQPLPVFVTYWTAWVDQDGLLHFRKDPYSLDSRDANPQVEIHPQEN